MRARHRVLTRGIALHRVVVEAAVGAEDVDRLGSVRTLAPGAAALALPGREVIRAARAFAEPFPSCHVFLLTGHGSASAGTRPPPNGPRSGGPFATAVRESSAWPGTSSFGAEETGKEW